jgi:hypothetical protein
MSPPLTVETTDARHEVISTRGNVPRAVRLQRPRQLMGARHKGCVCRPNFGSPFRTPEPSLHGVAPGEETKEVAIAGLALWAALAAFAGKAQAYIDYPWCVIGDTRASIGCLPSREHAPWTGGTGGGSASETPSSSPASGRIVERGRRSHGLRKSHAASTK